MGNDVCVHAGEHWGSKLTLAAENGGKPALRFLFLLAQHGALPHQCLCELVEITPRGQGAELPNGEYFSDFVRERLREELGEHGQVELAGVGWLGFSWGALPGKTPQIVFVSEYKD